MNEEPTEVPWSEADGDRPSGWSYRPRLDVCENDDELVVYADVPGTTAPLVDVALEDGTLVVHGTVRARRAPGTTYLVHDYGVGDFDRDLVIPDRVDGAGMRAELVDGVLTIHLPKREDARPRRIVVKET